MSKKSGKNARRINKELLAKLKHRKETNKRWKQEQVVSQESKSTVQACRYVAKKVKAQLKPNLTRDVEEMVSVNTLLALEIHRGKSKTKEDMSLLLNEAGTLVTQHVE